MRTLIYKKMCRQGFLFLSLLLCCFLLQGCVVSATLALSAAAKGQEQSAYTDYLFATLKHNQTLIQEGQNSEPVLSERVWVNEIYRPKIAYAYYYDANRNLTNEIVPFETWKKTGYPKWLEQQKQKTPPHR
jgi:hypothetical protein